MSLKPITVLRRARKLIEDRRSWIKGAFIGKRKGVQCYCSLGALATAAGVKVKDGQNLSNAAGGSLPNVYYQAHKFLRDAIGGSFIWVPSFNDDKQTRHAQVLKAFDKAIALAQAKKVPAPAQTPSVE
jgi:hypothetical protein